MKRWMLLLLALTLCVAVTVAASADNTFTSSAKVPATTMARRNNAVLACLPVSRVTVQAKTQAGNTVLRVTYDREKLLHKNFAFVDPVAFTESCGATWQE